MTPWDAYWSALEDLEAAERYGSPELVATAREAVALASEQCSILGGFLLVSAMSGEASLLVRRRVERVFGGLGKEAWEKAARASEVAREAIAEVVALWDAVKQLDRRVDELTPGVGRSVLSLLGEALGRIEKLEAKVAQLEKSNGEEETEVEDGREKEHPREDCGDPPPPELNAGGLRQVGAVPRER